MDELAQLFVWLLVIVLAINAIAGTTKQWFRAKFLGRP